MPPSTTAKLTTDHDEIRQWAEQRGAKPSAVIRTADNHSAGVLGLDFPGNNRDGSLKEISWDEWFGKFEKYKLAILYQEQTAGGERSDFNEIVSRKIADEVESAVGGRGRSATRRRAPKRKSPAPPRARTSSSAAAPDSKLSSSSPVTPGSRQRKSNTGRSSGGTVQPSGGRAR